MASCEIAPVAAGLSCCRICNNNPMHGWYAGYFAGVAASKEELAVKDELIRQLSERVAICSELLAKRAEKPVTASRDTPPSTSPPAPPTPRPSS